MNRSSQHVAVAGGGVAGSTAAILLQSAGARVDLFEARSVISGGSGIMLQANALRVLRAAGVLDDVLVAGFGFNSTGVRLPDATSQLVGEVNSSPDGQTPASIGIERTRLATILHRRAAEVGVQVQLGVEVTSVDSRAERADVSVRSRDGDDRRSFDLLVAADGLGSNIRKLMGIEATPRHLDLGVWRALTPRPSSVFRAEIINGGAAYFAGFAPTSLTQMYAWLVDDYVDRRALDPADQVPTVRSLAESYHGPWDDIRASLGPDTPISYTRYSELLVPAPWHRGRTVLIGDAAHACPPTLAQGAGMGLEDALVLADVIKAAGRVDDAVLSAFVARRLPRVRSVVEGSVQLAEWQLHGDRGEPGKLMGSIGAMLAQPA